MNIWCNDKVDVVPITEDGEHCSGCGHVVNAPIAWQCRACKYWNSAGTPNCSHCEGRAFLRDKIAKLDSAETVDKRDELVSLSAVLAILDSNSR